MLDARLDLPSDRRRDARPTSGSTWRSASRWSQPAGLWCFPIETVSQSEAGFEGVYQSSAVIPHWLVTADDSRRWEVRIRWRLDRAQTAVARGVRDRIHELLHGVDEFVTET